MDERGGFSFGVVAAVLAQGGHGSTVRIERVSRSMGGYDDESDKT